MDKVVRERLVEQIVEDELEQRQPPDLTQALQYPNRYLVYGVDYPAYAHRLEGRQSFLNHPFVIRENREKAC